jgi:hypothetical protein
VFGVSMNIHHHAIQIRSNDMSEKAQPIAKKEGEGSGKAEQPVEVKKKLPQLGALEDDDEFEVCLWIISFLSVFESGIPDFGVVSNRLGIVRGWHDCWTGLWN